jgi:hypothetical protein
VKSVRARRRRGHSGISKQEEVFSWNRNNPADIPGKVLVWNPEEVLTNETESTMKVPSTKYRNRGKFFPEHKVD